MRALLVSIIIASASGCMSGGTAKVIRELAKDPATAHLSVRTVYGTFEVDRTNPRTNSMPHSVKDGEIRVGP